MYCFLLCACTKSLQVISFTLSASHLNLLFGRVFFLLGTVLHADVLQCLGLTVRRLENYYLTYLVWSANWVRFQTPALDAWVVQSPCTLSVSIRGGSSQ